MTIAIDFGRKATKQTNNTKMSMNWACYLIDHHFPFNQFSNGFCAFNQLKLSAEIWQACLKGYICNRMYYKNVTIFLLLQDKIQEIIHS